MRFARPMTPGFRFSLVVMSALAAAPVAWGQSLQSVRHQKFAAEMQNVSEQLHGVAGYAIRDLTTGESFDHNADLVFPTASSIKLTILLELMRQAQQGELSLDEKHAILRRETVGGSGILHLLGDGTVTMNLHDLATFMVVLSDNSATNTLIDRIGMAKINAEIGRLGLTHTRLRRTMMDLAAAERGDENVSTPREMTTLVEKVHAGQALNAEFTRQYFNLLALPKDSPFHSALPDTVRIEDKPGSLEAVRCDAGIVEIPGHPFAMSVMTTYLANGDEGERAVEQIARLAYDYFDGLARSSAYGRAISEK